MRSLLSRFGPLTQVAEGVAGREFPLGLDWLNLFRLGGIVWVEAFSLYPIIRRELPKFGAGVHLKTAGTTWLEEVIGLAEAGGDGLAFAKEIYAGAIGHVDEFCAPYASVIDIDRAKLPTAEQVAGWTSEQFTGALRHDQKHPLFNPSLRQLLHVSFKLAAKAGQRYLDLLVANEEIVGKNVTENLYARHLKPLFVG